MTPLGHYSTPLDNMIAAATRLAALPVEGETPAAVETRRARELLQTALVQQQAYSYSRDRIHATPRPSRSYGRHIDSPAVSSTERRRGHDPVRREAELAAQPAVHHHAPAHPTVSVEVGVTSRAFGVPCLTAALRNERLPKDFKGPRRVPNYTADLPPEAWVESYEMAMEMVDVSEAAYAKYFTMMLEGTARTRLKGLPANSIGSWAELKARFIQNFKDTCKQPMSIVDLVSCVQAEGELTTSWVRRVSTIIHSSENINVGSAILMLDKNCRFTPLKKKLGRLKRHCDNMGTLMAALVKYADSDGTQDPDSEDERSGKGKKSSGMKGQQYNPANQSGKGKRKANNFVANTGARN